MEGSLVAYKVFTNGSVLNASEINDNLMNQSVMVFSNATARSAALTSPLEGMLTWLEDVNRYENYNGSAWVTLGSQPGLNFITRQTFSAVSSQSVNDVFSANYENYKLILNINSSSANPAINLRLRVAGADNTSNNYVAGGYYVGAYNSEGANFFNNLTQSYFEISYSNSTHGAGSETNLFSPFLTQSTKFTTQSGGSRSWGAAGGTNVTTSYTGFTIFPSSGNITGSVSVYGLRNS
jgi:hypothetical protein